MTFGSFSSERRRRQGARRRCAARGGRLSLALTTPVRRRIGMRGLVTVFGGSGFIGSQTVRALAKQGWRIRVAVRRPWQAYRQRLLGDVGQIEIVQANVRVAETVARAVEGAEAVVYAVGAAFESGRQSFSVVHAEGPKLAAEAAARQGVEQFAFISGIGADPGSASKAGRAKAEGEAAVRAAIRG